MKNYMKLKSYSPFMSSYVFLDCGEYLADQLFIKNKVPVKFGNEYARDDSRYRIIFCKIRKKYENNFLKALSEMYNKMILRGYEDYQEFCGEFNEMMMNVRGI